MSAVLVHKAVEPDNLTVPGKKRYKRLVQGLIDGDGSAALYYKYDGVYAQFIWSDREGWRAFSRTGQLLKSVGEEILDGFYNNAIQDRRYNGELWLSATAHQTINGLARKQSPQHLNLRLFDSVAERNLLALSYGAHTETFREREGYLFSTKSSVIQPAARYARYHSAITQESDLYAEAQDFKVSRESSAYDGLILRDMAGLYLPGAGKGGEIIKIKPRKSGDFRVVGVTGGIGNRAGGIGALVVDLGKGRTSEVGSGLSLAQVFAENSPIGQIATVDYLGLTKDGKLREPSFIAYRFDKNEADVLPLDEVED